MLGGIAQSRKPVRVFWPTATLTWAAATESTDVPFCTRVTEVPGKRSIRWQTSAMMFADCPPPPPGSSLTESMRAASRAPCLTSRFWAKTHPNSITPRRRRTRNGVTSAISTMAAPRSESLARFITSTGRSRPARASWGSSTAGVRGACRGRGRRPRSR